MTLLTEDEAKTKWCPYVRWVYVPAASLAFNNRIASAADLDGDDPKRSQGRCIGSACMAWRKATDPKTEFDKYGNLPGYCGAFGKVSP